MDSDFFLILGIILMLFAIPSALSAFADKRGPRSAVLFLGLGGAMFLGAAFSKPGGYVFAEIPMVFYTVISRFIY